MGSKPRKKSTRPEPGPWPLSAQETAEQALQDARSLFACAARCLDEIAEPHQLDAPEGCDVTDVAVLVRAGIQRLNEGRTALDGATP
jgi:hypothetical protein